MITKENYLEIGHVECSECNASLDWNAVDDAIRKHGLIALHRESDGSGYFGYTCPHCIKTILYKTNKDFLKFLASGSLMNPEKKRPHPKGNYHLGYSYNLFNSVFNLGFEMSLFRPFASNCFAMNACFERSAYFLMMHKMEPFFKTSKAILSNYYCTALPDTIAIGPIIQIQYLINNSRHLFKVNSPGLQSIPELVSLGNEVDLIEKIRKKENQAQTKVFNRYVLIDPFYSLINEYNMKHGRYSDFHILSKKRDEIDAPDPQKRITQVVDFLNLICIPNVDSYTIDISNNAHNRALYPTHLMVSDFSEQKNIYKTIWNKFQNNNLQNLLRIMADNFLDEYSDLHFRIDCSFEKIWELRQKYIHDIFDSIKTPKKMRQKQQDEIDKYIETFKKIEEPYPALQKIITQNYNLIQIKELLLKIFKSNLIEIFLLLGETGTGKELFAKAIHEISGKTGAFIPINCAAIPDKMFEAEFFGHAKGSFTGATNDKIGLFEQADGGTVFLDEIGELDANFQARLLRALQEKEIKPVGGELKKIDFQLVSATNCNLREMIDAGKFREDLYQRITEYTIPIPSLAERKNDISLLAQNFINKYDMNANETPSLQPLSIGKECLTTLEGYHWRGNVRELERACKLVLAFRNSDDRSEIDISEFNLEKETEPTKGHKSNKIKQESKGPGNTRITDDQVRKALSKHNGNKTRAGEELGVTYDTILRRSKKLDI